MKRCLLVWVVMVWGSLARADNWPTWRGPQHNGISKDTNLPVEWSASKNVAWKLKMPGVGSSTPCIWDNSIFLTSEDDGNIVLLCISTNGKERWKRKIGAGNKWIRGDEGNSASASPATDGKNVYAFSTAGDLAAFDFDGNEVWKVDIQKRYGEFRIAFGLHSTPVLHGDRLYLQLIHDNGAWVIAIDKTNGNEVWKVKRVSDGTGENKHSYASPCLWTNGKDAYLITHGNDYAIAYSLDDGKEIWRVGGLNPQGKGYRGDLRFVSSPVGTPDLIVVPSAKKKGIAGIKPNATGLVMPGDKSELWRQPDKTPDVSSPLVHDGLVYLCREDGYLICLDAKTGKQHYNERIYSDRYRASPVYADGKIYLCSRKGVFTVVKAGSQFERLAENKLPDQMTASPAIANGRIYLRCWESLYAIEGK
jgi:outer membrane protein assembly factor BamB